MELIKEMADVFIMSIRVGAGLKVLINKEKEEFLYE